MKYLVHRKAYREKHPAYLAEWRASNPDKAKAYKAKAKAKAKANT